MIPRPAILRSFRLRIALLSTALAGVVLAAFCAGAWALVYRASLDRVDEDIRRSAMRPLSARQDPRDWAAIDDSLRFVLGDGGDAPPLIMLVKRPDGSVEYQSPGWPEGLSADAFPTPEPAPPGPPRRMRGGGPQGGGPPWRQNADFPPPPDQAGPRPPLPPGPPNRPGFQEPFGGPPPPVQLETHRFLTFTGGGGEWRVGVMGGPGVTLALGRDTGRLKNEMRALRNAFLAALPLALLLIAAGGWWVSGRVLRPVRALTNAAANITARGLGRRIAPSGEDPEFDRLIAVFNEMLDRLEKSFQQALRFSADAAHELKTPLTILQGELEQALQAEAPGSPRQASLGALLEETQRLKAIIKKLLLLSLADSGGLRLNPEPVDLSELAEAACDDAEILAPALAVLRGIEPGLSVAADGDLLRQVVQNLASNAIKYNQPGGHIRVTLRRAPGGGARLTVENTGPGIPPEDREKVFQRFYRADKARNRNVDGAGLGLSLAREIMRAHGGTLTLDDSPPGLTAFTLTLPGPQETAK
jgi:two-component system, OmpR family, heavy metal sensor histidine kinase CusS